MKKNYNNPECKILLLQSEDVMLIASKNTYDNAEAADQQANAWDWEY